MKSAPARPGTGRGRLPSHVAWVGVGSGRWQGGTLAEAEDRAVLALVDGSLDAGIRWLTIQHPAAPRPLAAAYGALAARGIEVLVLGAGGANGDGSRLVPLGELGANGLPDSGPRGPHRAPALRVVLAPEASGHRQLVDAVGDLDARGMRADKVDEDAIAGALAVPDVDLLVVTGGDRRVPDLLLWQIAYSEIVFCPTLWPDVGRADLDAALEDYRRRDRRYGGLVTSR